MIERSRTLFVGLVAFILLLIVFSSFQKNKQTEGFGSDAKIRHHECQISP